MECKTYFHSARQPGQQDYLLYVRVGNALSRADIRTMCELCELPEADLKQIRNLGRKGLSIAMAERQKYQETLAGSGCGRLV